MFPRKILGALIFTIAIGLCLTVCSMPEMLSQKKASSGSCHTEEEEKDSGERGQQHCCDRDSILPDRVGSKFNESGQEGYSDYSPASPGIGVDIAPAVYHRLTPNSSPPSTPTILRI